MDASEADKRNNRSSAVRLTVGAARSTKIGPGGQIGGAARTRSPASSSPSGTDGDDDDGDGDGDDDDGDGDDDDD
eukprot:3730043-Pyramimonas_sp.AAC.1